jgi:hypothetical protein
MYRLKKIFVLYKQQQQQQQQVYQKRAEKFEINKVHGCRDEGTRCVSLHTAITINVKKVK